MANVSFATGLQEAYQALVSASTVDENVIYFITDTRRIYKGSTQVADVSSQQIVFTTSTPTPEASQEGILYVATVDGTTTIYTKISEEMVVVGGGEATSVADGSIVFSSLSPDMVATSISDSPSEAKIPTEKAVKDYVDSIQEALSTTLDGVVASVTVPEEAQPESGTLLRITKVDGTHSDITIADLFLSAASYDSETHILTLTVGDGASTVEVNLEDLVPQSVNASQVAMAREITVTAKTGNLNPGDKVILTGDPQSGEIKAADVQAMFEAILSKDVNPTTVQPSASVSLTGAGAKEVGTQFTPSYSASLKPGSYNVEGQEPQATGVTATSYAITDTNSGSADTQSGSLTAFTVEDDTDYYVSATISYGDGSIPKTFLGNEYPAGQIKAGSKSATSSHVTGFRNCWWGFKNAASLISAPESITSAEIKALGSSNRNKPTSYKPSGNWQQMFFAIPATQANSLSIVGTDSPLPQTVYGPITVQVGGVSDYSPIAYNVFYVNNASESSPDTYKLTWANS